MKALAIIGMPSACGSCWFCTSYGLCFLGNREVSIYANKRDSECPLKPMPQQMKTDEDDIEEDSYWQGWNDCLDEIMGETE